MQQPIGILAIYGALTQALVFVFNKQPAEQICQVRVFLDILEAWFRLENTLLIHLLSHCFVGRVQEWRMARQQLMHQHGQCPPVHLVAVTGTDVNQF